VSLLLLSPPELPVLLIAQNTESPVSSLLKPPFLAQDNNSARLSPVITATCLRRCHPKYAQISAIHRLAGVLLFLFVPTQYVQAAFMRDCGWLILDHPGTIFLAAYY
jgi:hypothetical protein